MTRIRFFIWLFVIAMLACLGGIYIGVRTGRQINSGNDSLTHFDETDMRLSSAVDNISDLLETERPRCAEMQLIVLTLVLKDYKESFGHFPGDLNELTQDKEFCSKHGIRPSLIVDPWDKLFQYDKVGKHSGGRYPDVWTNGPKGDKVVVGNWK